MRSPRHGIVSGTFFVFLRHKAMATFVLWGMISPSLILYSVCSCTYAV